MKTELSETELVLAISKQSLSAAEVLYDRYAQTLFKIIYCSCKNPDTNFLVLEQTIMTVWNNIEDYNTKGGSFLLWMAGKARTLAKKAEKGVNTEEITVFSVPLPYNKAVRLVQFDTVIH